MRICIDLDGTICETRLEGQSYKTVKPLPGAVETLQRLKKEGHYLIIATARHMETCNGSLGLILAKQGKITFEWLDKYHIPYDEIWFQKPLAQYYIDDRAFKFENWAKTKKQLDKFIYQQKMNNE